MSDDKQAKDEETSQAGGTSKPEAEAATSPDSEENVKATAEESQQEDESPVDDKVELDKKAEDGKMSKLEKERNEAVEDLKREREEQQQPKDLQLTPEESARLDQKFFGNKDEYELWRADKLRDKFKDPGPYERVYSGYKPGEGRTETDNQGVSRAAPTQEQPDLVTQVKESMRFEDAFGSFVKKVPELDPEKQESQAERDEAQESAMKLARLAGAHKAENPGMSYDDALEIAWMSFPGNRDKLLERAREDGRLVGKHEVYAKGSGETGAIAGGTAKGKTDKVTLTDEEKDLAKRSHISEEDVLKEKKRDLARQQQGLTGGIQG